MAGPVPAIHVFSFEELKTWMPATSAGTRDKNARIRYHKCASNSFDASQFLPSLVNAALATASAVMPKCL